MALIFLKYVKEKEEKLKNAESYMREKINEIKKVLPDAKIFIFGSVVEGTYDIISDVDVAIVSNKIKITLEIQKILGTPFEIHLFTEEEWKEYKRFTKYKQVS